MKILSLFDGISCGRVALERAGIPVDKYYASEIDKYAIQTSEKNYPDIIRLGDVKTCELPKDIDILFAGFPCQSFSIAGNRKGFDDERGNLFFDLMRIFQEVKPKYFLFENVASMKKADKQKLDEIIGVEGIMVNSALVSAQQRRRIYWTNISFTQPEDEGIVLKDIIEDNTDIKHFLSKRMAKTIIGWEEKQKAKGNSFKANIFKKNSEDKSSTLKATYHKIQGDGSYIIDEPNKSRGAKTELYLDKSQVRKLTPIECERLQTLPDNYTAGCSNTQRYRQCGNGWTVDVIAHILSFIK